MLFLILLFAAFSLQSPIKHVVLLVLENRSFDSIFGGYSTQNPLNFNYDYNKSKIFTISDDNLITYFDPPHSFDNCTEQIYGTSTSFNTSLPSMSGFAKLAYRKALDDNIDPTLAMQVVMGSQNQKSVPILYKLANEFMLFDRWHASFPGPTFPNRNFINCATSGGHTDNIFPNGGYPMRTIFDSLNNASVSWKAYIKGWKPSLLLFKNMRKPQNLIKFRGFKSFIKDARKGRLPNFSFIDPDFEKDDGHPPSLLYNAELLVKTIYEAVRNSPQWESTALLITFDEHGGFYDHIPPPINVPAPDDSPVTPNNEFKFDRLGVRVPTILISPYIPKGSVNSKLFEHSSIAATLKNIFQLDDFLTRRDAWANSFHEEFNLKNPRTDCPKTLTWDS